jgi:hypothetical protein
MMEVSAGTGSYYYRLMEPLLIVGLFDRCEAEGRE